MTLPLPSPYPSYHPRYVKPFESQEKDGQSLYYLNGYWFNAFAPNPNSFIQSMCSDGKRSHILMINKLWQVEIRSYGSLQVSHSEMRILVKDGKWKVKSFSLVVIKNLKILEILWKFWWPSSCVVLNILCLAIQPYPISFSNLYLDLFNIIFHHHCYKEIMIQRPRWEKEY